MKKVGIYVRVSTLDQAEEGYSIDEQVDKLTKYCEINNWIVGDTYIDPGYSGSNLERPAMKKLIQDVKNAKINTVLIYKLDRMSRNVQDTLHLVKDIFNKNGADFVSLKENIDTSTPIGGLFLTLLSAIAEFEREQITERMQMGLSARAKAGHYHGGGFDPVGYDYIDGKLVINEYEAMQIRKVHELFQKGIPIDRIQKIMQKKYSTKHGSWGNHSAVRNALTRKVYTGKIVWKGEVYEGLHEPIISEESYNRTITRYKEISWKKGNEEHKKRPFQAKHALTGLLYCNHCGARYFAKGSWSGRGDNRYYRPYYTCYSRARSNKKMIIDPNCMNKIYAVVILDEIIGNIVKKLAFDETYFNEIVENSDSRNTDAEKRTINLRIEEIDKQMNRMLDLYQLGGVTFEDVSKRIERLNVEKISLEEDVENLFTENSRMSVSEAKELLLKAENTLNNGELQEKRELLHSLIERIDLDGECINIKWAFV